MTEKTITEAKCLFSIARDSLLASLKNVSGVVEPSQVMQILSYVKLSGQGNHVTIMASNSEVEVETSARLFAESKDAFSLALPCRKLMDICKLLPESSVIEFVLKDQWVEVRAKDANFKLSSLPSQSFPLLPRLEVLHQIEIPEDVLKLSIEKSCFSMAYQDARFFLNGLLFECLDKKVNCVATDGHRLSWANAALLGSSVQGTSQSIIPRKTVIELTRLLRATDAAVHISLAQHAIEIRAGHFIMRSNLIEGKYPNYTKLVPKDVSAAATVEVQALKLALGRVAILANEKFKGAKFYFSQGQLKIVGRNFDQEEAVSQLPIGYEGSDREVAFNIGYVLDVLSAVETDEVVFQFSEKMQGVLLEQPGSDAVAYVIMPLTL
ncbi:DNA polymerase III subunit beta [Candidatus Comchoanobacter bicostacola]|uniref:Beta sliding clamp n=1 Tax=Candidatus Comchoanobacter bicostacola TaxID=2919598 RepID=A0ABY5DKR7_9GAMM|nr:DNA polymerase III subunit beta [Candidatus Comchoanobacter bicostacola]UTC24578.1 DNA polymerase III subunit beta [Candidatus Comchoanobacter bicostacola]